MGIQQSSMQCTNEEKKCSFTQPMPYNEYITFTKTLAPNLSESEKQKAIATHVCGTNTGVVNQCCNKTSATANTLATPTKYIKKTYDVGGNITEYQTCNCTSEACHKINCPTFVPATNYEICKARTINANKTIKVDQYVNRMAVNDLYIDCYKIC